MPGSLLPAGAVFVRKMHTKDAHEHTGIVGAIRHFLRNGFTALCSFLPGTRLVFPPSLTNRRYRNPALS